MRHFLAALDYPGKDPSVALPPDPLIVGQASHVVRASEHILGSSLHPDHRRSARGGHKPASEKPTDTPAAEPDSEPDTSQV
jgi:hypothetical protein